MPTCRTHILPYNSGVQEQLSLLEKDVQAFFEGLFSGLPGAGFSPGAIAQHLAREVVNATKRTDEGRVYVPDQYTLSMHPLDVEVLLRLSPHFQADLAYRLRDVLGRMGFLLVREPHVTLATDPTVAQWEIRVFAWRSSTPQTAAPSETRPPLQADQPPPGAFLLIEGKRHFPLTQTTIKIGRRHDNDLSLSDPHVSRVHAEVRLMEGRYVIADLGSTAGTFVNGRQIKQHILEPGDVISVAVVQLLYGEDPSGPPGVTPPYTPPRLPKVDRDHVTPHYLRTLTDSRKPSKKP